MYFFLLHSGVIIIKETFMKKIIYFFCELRKKHSNFGSIIPPKYWNKAF